MAPDAGDFRVQVAADQKGYIVWQVTRVPDLAEDFGLLFPDPVQLQAGIQVAEYG